MLYLIKFLYSFLLPPGIYVLLLLLVSFWLYRRRSGGAGLVLVIAVLMYIFSTHFVGDHLVKALEDRYHPPVKVQGDVLVMLGGGATMGTPDVDGRGQLKGSSANRMLTTARLYFRTKLPVIISGGQVYADSGNEAEIAKRQLVSLGVPAERIFTDSASRNTAENVTNVKAIMKKQGFKRVVVVTSAFHMERAMLYFEQAGVAAQAYPTDYQVSSKIAVYLNNFKPGSDDHLYKALNEYLGILAVRLHLH